MTKPPIYDDPPEDVTARYRRASARNASAPSQLTRDAILARARAAAAERGSAASRHVFETSTPAANDSGWWRRAVAGLAVVGLVGVIALQTYRTTPREPVGAYSAESIDTEQSAAVAPVTYAPTPAGDLAPIPATAQRQAETPAAAPAAKASRALMENLAGAGEQARDQSSPASAGAQRYESRALAPSPSPAAAESEKVSKPLEKPLKAAQDAMAARNQEEALAKLREAQALPNKSSYDQFVINEFLGPIYAQQSKFGEAFEAFAANAESPYLTGKAARYKLLSQLGYQMKNYSAAVEYGNRAIEGGEDGDDVRLIVAQSYYLQNKCKEATASMQELVARSERDGNRPAEQSLLLIRQCLQKMNDEAGQGRVLEKLLTYYPKPDYWTLAIDSLMQMAGKDEGLKLQVYRLMAEVGTLPRPDQYTEMARLDIEQGFPGEAQTVLEQGLARNVFTEPREKERNGRLLELAKKQLANERSGLSKLEAEAAATSNGELLVAVGSRYMMNLADPGKGVALISEGIAKGSLNSMNDAYIMLGLANARSKNTADAQQAFAKIDKHEAYERLARLWMLRVR